MKKALSLLLAVLMLVSLFGTMAFADDDVVEEEVVAEEPAPVEEVTGDGAEEAAAAVEEYTDEGSFEAADAYTPAVIHGLEPLDPANPQPGEYVLDKWTTLDGEVITEPKKHEAKAYAWMKQVISVTGGNIEYGNPEKYYVIVPHVWGNWTTVSEGEATCTSGGYVHDERKCLGDAANPNCKGVEKSASRYLPMQPHVYVMDETYSEFSTNAGLNPNGVKGDDRAVVKKPTCAANGVGNWVCKNCGAYAPETIFVNGQEVPGRYEIVRMTKWGWTYYPEYDTLDDLDPRYHDWGAWNDIVPATCVSNGTQAHYCNICKAQATRDVEAYHHKNPDGTSAIEFLRIERVDCTHYVEVWGCTIPGCKGGFKGAQFLQYRGFEDNGKDGRKVLKDNETAVLPDVKTLTATDCFEYEKYYDKDFTTVYVDNNPEHVKHHRFVVDWTLVEEPKCCVAGKWARTCADCNPTADPAATEGVEFKPEPALEPIYGDEVHTGFISGAYVHWVCCTRTECKDIVDHATGSAKEPVFNKIPGIWHDDPRFYTQANNSNPQVMIVDHDWSEWTCYVKPVEGVTLGHWTRTCLVMDEAQNGDHTKCTACVAPCLANDEFVGTQKQFDDMNAHPVLQAGLIPEIIDGVVVYKLYEMGIFQEDFTGIAECYCEGVYGKFYVKDGIWQKESNGAKLVGETWYFLANGKVQEVTQLAEYQGEWFYVKNGVIDTEMNGLVDYDGGTFMLGAGRIQKEVSGLWENSKKIGGDGDWYYLANGQVQKDYTGLVQYDGEWFYVENGKLVPYNGQVEYDGEIFNVKNGMVVA